MDDVRLSVTNDNTFKPLVRSFSEDAGPSSNYWESSSKIEPVFSIASDLMSNSELDGNVRLCNGLKSIFRQPYNWYNLNQNQFVIFKCKKILFFTRINESLCHNFND